MAHIEAKSEVETYIIGAGSTASFSEESKRIKAPVDNDFFATAQKVLQAETQYLPSFEDLRAFLSKLFRPFSSTECEFGDLPGLEEVMTILDSKIRSDSTARQHYERLLDLIVLTLWKTTTEGGGEVSSKQHEKLVGHMLNVPQNRIISFNYDYLMDKALKSKSLVNTLGYGVNFDWEFSSSGFQRVKENEPIGWERCRLYKLHGSMDWWRCGECNSLVNIVNARDFTRILESRLKLRDDKQFVCLNCNTESFAPFLIPPLLMKNYVETEWRHIWKNAKRAVVEANKILIWGYSLPTTDFEAEYLFRDAMVSRENLGNSQLGELDLVIHDARNKMPRIEKIFRPKLAQSYNSIEEYFDQKGIL